MTKPKVKKIWIDLDNSPHVPFFKPIVDELTKRGYSMILTARDCFQVCELADLWHLEHKRVGRHFGKNVVMKSCGLILRSMQLAPLILSEKPDLAVSHGSRSQVILAQVLGMPSVVILDYEYARVLTRPTWVIAPDVIPEGNMHAVKKGFLSYPGIKEDVYAPSFKPDPTLREDLKLDKSKIVITIRPPATYAHYHNPEAETLFVAITDYLGKQDKVQMVMVPRNQQQETYITQKWPELCQRGVIIIPDHVVDGLNLIWHSDLVISGGGTMNREAAALGVPVYSFFRGKIGAVDRYLVEKDRLVLLSSINDIFLKLKIEKRDIEKNNSHTSNGACESIVQSIIRIIEN
jgi:hypothetical protein